MKGFENIKKNYFNIFKNGNVLLMESWNIVFHQSCNETFFYSKMAFKIIHPYFVKNEGRRALKG